MLKKYSLAAGRVGFASCCFVAGLHLIGAGLVVVTR